MRKWRYISISVLSIVIVLLVAYCYMYYPQQSMPIGEPILVTTPDSTKYHNDCLHPCIRYCEKTGKYYMAQSPYYGWNNTIENPIFYSSDTYNKWDSGILISDTPEYGYNSDPNIFISDDGSIMYIWRECETPLCDSLGCFNATVGGLINEEGVLENKAVYCINYSHTQDIEQAPVMIERNGIRYIYATWYQYEPVRKNRGIAIWREDTIIAKGGGAHV